MTDYGSSDPNHDINEQRRALTGIIGASFFGPWITDSDISDPREGYLKSDTHSYREKNTGDVSPSVQWSKRLADKQGIAVDVLESRNGSYIFSGARYYSARDGAWLGELTPSGETKWRRSYEGGTLKLLEVSDGGYLMVGSGFGDTEYGASAMKVDSKGNIEWTQAFGGRLAFTGCPTGDGGVLLGGQDREYYPQLVKIDSSGEVQWRQSFTAAGHSDQAIYDVVVAGDGGFVFGTGTRSAGVESSQAWLVKVNGKGEQEWRRSYGNDDWNDVSSLVTTREGGYAFAGSAGQFIPTPAGETTVELWLVKVDSDGEPEWSQRLGGRWGSSVAETVTGNLRIGGVGIREAEGQPIIVIQTDADGDVMWRKHLQDNGNVYANLHSLETSSENGTIIAADVSTGGTPSPLLVKLDGDSSESDEPLPNTLLIKSTAEGFAFYEFTVTGDLKPGPRADTEDPSSLDTIRGQTAYGLVGRFGIDEYQFGGDVSEITVRGPATVSVNGEEIEGTNPYPNDLRIESTGEEYAYYEITVSGEIRPGPNADTDDPSKPDVIRDGRVQGQVGRYGIDDFRFSGDVTSVQLDGPANVLVNGTEIQ